MKGDGAVRLLFIAAVTKRRLDAVDSTRLRDTTRNSN